MNSPLPPLDITREELRQLVMLSGIKPDPSSPLPALPVENDRTVRHVPGGTLQESGWLEQRTGLGVMGLSSQAGAALRALLQPKTSVQLVLGDSQEILVTEMYSADGFRDGQLVIFTERKAEGRYIIRPGISPSQVSDALLEHLMVGPRLDGLEFAVNLPSQAALIFFCVLDRIHTMRIISKLQNDRETSFAFTSHALWQRAMEIQMGDDLMWMSALLPYLFPSLQFSISEEMISGLLDELKGLGYLDRSQEGFYYPNDLMIALADALVPMLSFGSCAIRQMEEGLIGFHLAFVVGVGTNLVLEAVPGADGRHWLQLTAVNGIELSKLLYRIGFPQDPAGQTPAAPARPMEEMKSPGSGAGNPPAQVNNRRFCSGCGAALRPGVRFCPKCGRQQVERGS